jgi:hypothetical protein
MMLDEFDLSPDRFHIVSAVHEAEIEIFISRNTVYSTHYWWVWNSIRFGTFILICSIKLPRFVCENDNEFSCSVKVGNFLNHPISSYEMTTFITLSAVPVLFRFESRKKRSGFSENQSLIGLIS